MFRSFDGRRVGPSYRTDVLSSVAITYPQCRMAFLRSVASATGRSVEEVTPMFGTQSCRIGGATAVASKVDFRLFQQHGAWKSPKTAMRYVKDSVDTRLQPTRVATR